ncbi:hypothetical protein [Carboxylicivirga sp. M1479]|uniref:hypothetical protein n=1 Tax=Carboxylicivirga sp. M1479 TaxID=2594476 RepID=UPI00117830E7|nr:hypothetical protein [Carboxylicivirga sp. M1479]TRX71012.1 hypothetical protein FNN09_08345 [Carboxylicivirga sp. M1479]
MSKIYLILLLIVLLAATKVSGQVQKVWLHGQVVRQSDSRPIPLAQLASFKMKNVFAADSSGQFKVILDNNDSIKVFALGFEPIIIHLDSLNVDADRMYSFALHQISYQIEQVDVNVSKHYMDYTDKLKAIRKKQEEIDLMLPADIKLGRKPEIAVDLLPTYSRKPPVLAAIFQPANVLYYYTSKSEKQKRQMLKLLQYEKQRQLMTLDMLEAVSGLSDEELQAFMMYCNAHIKFDKKDTELSVKYKVIDLFNDYKEGK